jgi:catechol 2,3-dioxygenase-like lactoylglutathione lyase family enzyme
MRVLGTHHVALTTRHFERLRAFYAETLGLPVVGGFAGHNIVFLVAGNTVIELIEDMGVATSTDKETKTGGWDHLALEVADVDAAYDELASRGVSFAVPPEDFPPAPATPTMRIAFLRDPDGNLVELVQPLGDRYPSDSGR